MSSSSVAAARKAKPAVNAAKRKEPDTETKTVAQIKKPRVEEPDSGEFKAYVPQTPTPAPVRHATPKQSPREKTFKPYVISDVKAEQLNLNLKKNHPRYFSNIRLSDWAVTITKKGNIFVYDTGNSTSSQAGMLTPFANVRRSAIWEYGDNKIDNPESKFGSETYAKAKTWIQLTNESLHAFDSDGSVTTNEAMDEFFEFIAMKVVPWFAKELLRLKPEKYKEYFEKAERLADERIKMIEESGGKVNKSRAELVEEQFLRACISPPFKSSKEGGIATMNCSSWVFGFPFNMSATEKDAFDFSDYDDGGIRQSVWEETKKVYMDLPLIDIHTKKTVPLKERVIPAAGAVLSLSVNLEVSEDPKTKTIGLKFSPNLVYIAGVNADNSDEQVNAFYNSIGNVEVKAGAVPVGDIEMIDDEDNDAPVVSHSNGKTEDNSTAEAEVSQQEQMEEQQQQEEEEEEEQQQEDEEQEEEEQEEEEAPAMTQS